MDLTSPNCWNLRRSSLSSIWPVCEPRRVTCSVPCSCYWILRPRCKVEWWFCSPDSSPFQHLSGHHVEGNSEHQSDWGKVIIVKASIKFKYLTGRPLISDPWRRSLALSAARRSYWPTNSITMVWKTKSSGAHIGYEDHSSCRDQIKESLDFSMLFKNMTDIITGCFILMTLLALIPLSIQIWKKNNWEALGRQRRKFRGRTCLNVADEQRTTGSFTLDSFLDDRVMHLIVFFLPEGASIGTIIVFIISRSV